MPVEDPLWNYFVARSVEIHVLRLFQLWANIVGQNWYCELGHLKRLLLFISADRDERFRSCSFVSFINPNLGPFECPRTRPGEHLYRRWVPVNILVMIRSYVFMYIVQLVCCTIWRFLFSTLWKYFSIVIKDCSSVSRIFTWSIILIFRHLYRSSNYLNCSKRKMHKRGCTRIYIV